MTYDIVIGRNESDKEKFGKKGVVLLGRSYVTMGRTTALSNYIYMDVAKGHVVYIVGKRGSGKCLLGSEKIHLANGKKLAIKEIFDIYESKGKVVKEDTIEKIVELKATLPILSMAHNLKLTVMKASHIYRKKVNEKLIMIKLNNGLSITVTKEHPLFTFRNELFSWEKAGDLKKGNKVAVPYTQNSLPKEDIQSLGKKTYMTEITNVADIMFECIEEIKEVEHMGYVYDLTIPGTHNFVAGDNEGIICHNSYTMGAIAEGIIDLPKEISKNLSMIILDTMGVYWTMKYPNEKDLDLLDMWGLQGKGLDVKIYTPKGFYHKYKEQGIPTDYAFSLKVSSLNAQDWRLTFELPSSHPVAIIIEKIIGDFKDAKNVDYDLDDMIEAIEKDKTFETKEKNEAINRLRSAKRWGLFTKEGMNLLELAKGGQVSILDVSCYAAGEAGWGVKNLVIGLVGQTIFNHRMLVRKDEELDSIKEGYSYFAAGKESGKKKELPIAWLVIDEAHEFLPKEGHTAATDALVTIMREGRQPGVCLMLATQQPGKIHTDVMSQSDIVIAHRLTAKPDVEALASMSQSYLSKSLPRMLDELPRVKGAAIVLDDTSERFYPIRVRPRITWHGGEAPSAIPFKRTLDLGLK